MARYPEILRVRVPTAFGVALSTAGKRRHTSGPEWLRQTVLRALEQEGVLLRPDGQVEQFEPARGAQPLRAGY